MMKKIGCILLLGMLLAAIPITVSAQTDSLATWENIADGNLIEEWDEVLTGNGGWVGQNISGIWEYNCTTDDTAWSIAKDDLNQQILTTRGYQTYEVTAEDAETGVGSYHALNSTNSSGYGVVYYVDGSAHGTGAECYIIYNDAGTIHYWNGTGFTSDDNISNATDYSNNAEVDYTSGWCRIKALWNWNETFDDCTIRFKIWNPSGDEPNTWMVDEIITLYISDSTVYFEQSLFVDSRFSGMAETDFRRIWFWNLSYTMTPGLNHVIDCPTVSINDILTTYADAEDPDIWNTTQLYKDMINLFDLTSFYDEDFWGETGNQNDTIYVFSMMLTDMDDYWDMYFPAPPDELPDNVLILHIYETTDGTSNDTDELLIRWDTDNDGTYESTDVAMWTNDTNTRFYNGWTENVDVLEYCVMSSGASTSGYAGEVFRDSLYWDRVVLINWDNMYNGSSGERIMDDECRMSMMFYDNASDSIAVLQDFYPGDDDSHYANTDGRNKSLNPTWYAENDSSFWTLFQADETITGETLSDPEDPTSIYTNMDDTTSNLLQEILPIVLAAAFLTVLVGMFFTGTLTIESLIALMVSAIIVVITITIIIGL